MINLHEPNVSLNYSHNEQLWRGITTSSTEGRLASIMVYDICMESCFTVPTISSASSKTSLRTNSIKHCS